MAVVAAALLVLQGAGPASGVAGFTRAAEDGRPLAGVVVELVNLGPDGLFGTADDVLVATATTGPTGSYIFTGLNPSSYVVQVTPPAGYTQTGDPDRLQPDRGPRRHGPRAKTAATSPATAAAAIDLAARYAERLQDLTLAAVCRPLESPV